MGEWIVPVWAWIERFFAALWFGFQWPHAVLAIFAAVLMLYRIELKGLIPRIQQIGANGLVMAAPSPTTAQQDSQDESEQIVSGPTDEPESGPPPPSIPPPPVATEYPAAHKQVLAFINSQIQSLDPEAAKQYLVDHLVASRVLWTFENIYVYIFGGQIELLRYLNQRLGVGASSQEIEALWVTHQQQQKPGLDNWTSDAYLHFLRQRDLIIEANGMFQISPWGHEFLIWLIKSGRPSKPW